MSDVFQEPKKVLERPAKKPRVKSKKSRAELRYEKRLEVAVAVLNDALEDYKWEIPAVHRKAIKAQFTQLVKDWHYKCEDFHPGCMCCQAWAAFEAWFSSLTLLYAVKVRTETLAGPDVKP